jgi:hypothetical protein
MVKVTSVTKMKVAIGCDNTEYTPFSIHLNLWGTRKNEKTIISSSSTTKNPTSRRISKNAMSTRNPTNIAAVTNMRI